MKRFKILTIAIFSFLALTSNAQISVFGGTSLLKGFGVQKPFFGFLGGVELPNSNDVTFYGRVGYYFPQKEETTLTSNVTAINQTTTPYNLQVNYVTKTNYFTIEGGTRRYLGNDYDNGFSVFGGTNFMLFLNTVKRDYEKYDATGQYQWESKYEVAPTELNKGSIISMAVGLQGGLKYTLPATGTFFFDINGQYAILNRPSNLTAASTNLYSSLFFTFNLGFRKDLY
jgi:hypothetical protein